MHDVDDLVLVRVATPAGPRVGRLRDGRVDVLEHDDPLQGLSGVVAASLDASEADQLAPIEAPEIWCAGVTYERSRDARLEESETEARDVYSRVYLAERPELFLKDAAMRRTVGPGGAIHVRSDSSWSVPEPELGVVIGPAGEPFALTIGDDVSARDIEGENPLYLPQAKIFAGGCAIGPALVVPRDWDAARAIRMRIADQDGAELFAGETSTARMRRSPRELVAWLLRDNPVPPGSVLLTGTGLVPPGEFTLAPGQVVEIEIDGLGVLRNSVSR